MSIWLRRLACQVDHFKVEILALAWISARPDKTFAYATVAEVQVLFWAPELKRAPRLASPFCLLAGN
jgi:hypothetical protein